MKKVFYKGIEYPSLYKFCELHGLKYSTIVNRLRGDMTLEEAMTWSEVKDPITGKMYKNVTELLKAYGIKRDTFYSRMKSDWDIKDALTIKPGVIKNYAKRA